MANPFNNNSNKQQKSVNTRNRRLRNDEGPMPSIMELGYWDSNTTIRIHPALPKEMQTDTKKFDDENFLQATIAPDNAAILVDGIEKKIFPAIENGEAAQVNAIIGGDTVFQIATRKVDDRQVTLAVINKSLDSETRKPTSALAYHFRDMKVLEKYDPTTGASEVNLDSKSQLTLFTMHLKAQLLAGTNAFVHAHRVVDRTFREKLLGESSSSYTYGSKNNDVFGGSNGNNNYGSNSTSDTFGGTTEHLNNPEELEKLMGM